MFNNKEVSVLHVIEKLNDEEGGIFNIVKNLCKFLPTANNAILTTKIKNNKILKYFSCKVIKFSFLKFYYNKLLIKNVDIIHIHGIWNFLNTVIGIISIIKKKPYIISPQGMLEPWALEQKPIKKKIARLLFWDKILYNANCITFSSLQEYKNFVRISKNKNFKYKIIPNGCEPVGKYKIKKKK